MTQEELRLWVKDYVSHMEIGNSDPYKASFSTGNSGLSFGAMQNDVANNSAALATFENIMWSTSQQTGLSASQIQTIIDTAADGGTSTDFSQTQKDAINLAFKNAKPLIDQRDNAQLDTIMGYLNTAFNAAANNPNGPGALDLSNPDLQFIGELAEWGNRTGGLGASADYLHTTDEVSQNDFDFFYLSLQSQFTSGGDLRSSLATMITPTTKLMRRITFGQICVFGLTQTIMVSPTLANCTP